MSLHYGILRGRVDRFKREDDADSPHLQIRVVDSNDQAWRVAVNVLSGDDSLVIFHRADPLQGHPLVAALPGIATGFTLLPPAARSAVSALDYFRAPLFDWPTGVAIPHAGSGADDDLQDALVTYLTQVRDQAGEIFVFGAMFPEPGRPANPRPIDREFGTTQGMHDIHMNQGNPNPGAFAKDNGVFQDGGLILRFGTRHVGLFLRFQTQLLPTHNTSGHPLPGARPIPAANVPVVVGGGGGTTPVTDPAVYIERALVNPVGDDPGKEVVVLGNTMTASADLTGWRIVDKNNKAEILGHVVLPGGESRAVALSGQGAQLGNNGGTITLRNQAGEQIHAVSYAKGDAARENTYIRFTT